MKSYLHQRREEMLRPIRELEAKISKDAERKINEVMADEKARNNVMEEMLKCLSNKEQV